MERDSAPTVPIAVLMLIHRAATGREAGLPVPEVRGPATAQRSGSAGA